jgi:hypothetical protein
MDQIHLMKVFVAVGELESFAAAARRLDISRPPSPAPSAPWKSSSGSNCCCALPAACA